MNTTASYSIIVWFLVIIFNKLSKFLGDFISELVEGVEPPYVNQSPTHNSHFSGTNFFKKALESRSNKANTQKSYRTLGSPEVHRVVLTCSLYHTALNTLTQLQLDILTGIIFFNLQGDLSEKYFFRFMLSRQAAVRSLALFVFAWSQLWTENFLRSSSD